MLRTYAPSGPSLRTGCRSPHDYGASSRSAIGCRGERRSSSVLMAAIGLALYSGWNLVVAAGLSTLVLSLLPCAAMCALGLCASGSGKKCSDNTEKSKADDQ